jgi:hypothetical protein
MSDIAMFRQATSKNVMPVLLFALSSRRESTHTMQAASLWFASSPAAAKKLLSYLSSFACHFRFHN